MKSNQVMERPFMNGTVYQRTSDGFFNLTALAKFYNQYREDNPHLHLPEKEIDGYWRNKTTKEMLDALIEYKNLIPVNSGYSENTDNQEYLNPAFLQDLKITDIKRGKNGGTWVCPEVFVDFAMWLNPHFKVRVLEFVADNLILFRHSAGDHFRTLNKTMKENFAVCEQHHYINVTRKINQYVFGKPDSNQRNTATEAQLDLISKTENGIIDAIDSGFINDYNGVIQYIDKKIQKQLA